jgi:uracil-DNA glycosylase
LKAFTDAIIRVVAEETNAIFILWGRDAQKKTKALIDVSQRTVIASPHPSPRSAHKGFLGSKPFSRVDRALDAAGREVIDWRLVE